MSEASAKQNPTEGRINGKFAPGHSGNPAGRPRALDLRALAERQAEAEGISLEDAVWEVTKAMLHKAQQGDVAAAKLIFDKFTIPEEQLPLLVNIDARTGEERPPGPQMPHGHELADYLEGVAEAWREVVAANPGYYADEEPEEPKRLTHDVNMVPTGTTPTPAPDEPDEPEDEPDEDWGRRRGDGPRWPAPPPPRSSPPELGPRPTRRRRHPSP